MSNEEFDETPAYEISDDRINALIKASEVFEYHPGALLEFAREVAKEAVADDFLRTHAIEELHQLGYTVQDGNRLVPPDHLHLLMQAAKHPLVTQAQADHNAADAARYRWLRDVSVPPHNFYLSVPTEFDGVRYAPAEVDSYIDKARAA